MNTEVKPPKKRSNKNTFNHCNNASCSNIDEIMLLANIAENIQDPIITTDINACITRWNKSAEELFEWKANEVIGRVNLDVLKYKYYNETREEVFDIINKQGVYKGEYIVYTKSNKALTVLATISILKNSQNIVTGYLTLLKNITEFRETQKQVFKTENRFDKLVMNGIDCSVILNAQGQSTYVSPAVKKILGYSESEVKRLDVFTLVHPSDRDSIMEIWDKAILNPQEPITGKPSRLIHKDGTWHLLQFTLTNFLDDPNINGVVNTFWDVTETNELDHRLTITEFVIENAGDIVLFVAADASIVRANIAACEKLGYTSEEILQLKIFDIDLNFKPEAFTDMFNLLSQTKSKLFESTIIKKNGSIVPVEIWLNFIKHSDEEITCAFIRDISERKISEQKLLNAEKKFRALVENSTDGVVILDTFGKQIYTSPSVEKLLGYTEENTSELNLFSIIHPDDVSIAFNSWQEMLLNPGKSIAGMPARFLHKNGNYRWFESTLTNLLHEPAINGIVDNFWDVTEKKEAEDKLLLTQFAVDGSGDTVCWINADGKIVDVNQAMCNILGYSKQELLSLTVPDFDCVYTKEKWHLHFEELRQKKSIILETTQTTKDGRIIPVEIRANYIKYEDTELNCAFGRDITERKKSEEVILNKEKFFRSLIESSTDAFALLNTKGKAIYVSPTIKKVLGYTEEESLQLDFYSIFHPDDFTCKYHSN